MFDPSTDSLAGIRREAASCGGILLLLFLASCAAPRAGSAPPNLTSAAPESAELAASARAADAERVRQEVKGFGSSCVDIAALEEAGRRASDQSERDVYAAAASRRRYERTRDLEVAVDKVVQDAQSATRAAEDTEPASPAVADADVTRDPGALRARLHGALDLARTLACYDADAAKAAQRSVESSASALDGAVACRASPACRAGRLAGPICAAIAARDRAMADDLKKEYADLLHKSFDLGACPKPGKDHAKSAGDLAVTTP
jgi:hypothetical protein